MAASAPLKIARSLNQTCQIHCSYAMYGCKYSSKVDTVTFEEWMTATTFAKSKNTKKIRIFAIAGKGENNNINKKKTF